MSQMHQVVHDPLDVDLVCLQAAFLLGGSLEMHQVCIHESTGKELEGFLFLRMVVESLVGEERLAWRPEAETPPNTKELCESALRQIGLQLPPPPMPSDG